MTSTSSMFICCVRGMKHDGDFVGELKDVGGIKCYVAYPDDKTTKNGILYLPDAYGLELINNKLLADDFARAGYFTVIPDVFHGEPIPQRLLTEGFSSFDFPSWLASHLPTSVEPIIDATIKGMRELGVKNLGAVGYCFGGRYVVRYLAEGKDVNAGFIAHPSLVETEEIEAVVGPLSIAAAETDHQLSPEKRLAWEEILKKKASYQVNLYGACEHGFAVRTDLKDRKKKFAKESAYFQAVHWFDEWVKDPNSRI